MKSKDSFIISYNPIYTLESSQTEIFSIASGIQKRVKKVPFRKYFMRFFSLFRVSLTLSCPMTLELFPLDTQVCFLRVASCKCILRQYMLVLRHYVFSICILKMAGPQTMSSIPGNYLIPFNLFQTFSFPVALNSTATLATIVTLLPIQVCILLKRHLVSVKWSKARNSYFSFRTL